MLSEPVKALFESNTNARHAGDADRLAKDISRTECMY